MLMKGVIAIDYLNYAKLVNEFIDKRRKYPRNRITWQIKRGGGQAVKHFLFLTALAKCFLLTKYSKVKETVKG
jgi:hypothetical protein